MPRTIPHDAPIPIAECPDDVLEQIAHAGDCALNHGHLNPYAMLGSAISAVKNQRRHYPHWKTFVRAARWAARLLGVEVR